MCIRDSPTPADGEFCPAGGEQRKLGTAPFRHDKEGHPVYTGVILKCVGGNTGMDMKDQKLATEIAEERMTLLAPLLSQNLDKDSVRPVS